MYQLMITQKVHRNNEIDRSDTLLEGLQEVDREELQGVKVDY
jgi:hypothetical protein